MQKERYLKKGMTLGNAVGLGPCSKRSQHTSLYPLDVNKTVF